MDESQVRDEVVKFFEVVAPLSRRIRASRSKLPTPTFRVRDDRQDAWERGPSAVLGTWLGNERGTTLRFSKDHPFGARTTRGCYSPELNLIWVNSEIDDRHRLSVVTHECAHALTYDILLPERHKGVWARTVQHESAYNVGEIVAESSSFIATRQILHHNTVHSAMYVADYAAAERDVVGALTRALPLTVEASLKMIQALGV